MGYEIKISKNAVEQAITKMENTSNQITTIIQPPSSENILNVTTELEKLSQTLQDLFIFYKETLQNDNEKLRRSVDLMKTTEQDIATTIHQNSITLMR